MSDKNRALLSSVEDSISKNHRSLEIFGRVIDKVNGNGPLAKKVLFEFSKFLLVCTGITCDIVITRKGIC